MQLTECMDCAKWVCVCAAMMAAAAVVSLLIYVNAISYLPSHTHTHTNGRRQWHMGTDKLVSAASRRHYSLSIYYYLLLLRWCCTPRCSTRRCVSMRSGAHSLCTFFVIINASRRLSIRYFYWINIWISIHFSHSNRPPLLPLWIARWLCLSAVFFLFFDVFVDCSICICIE